MRGGFSILVVMLVLVNQGVAAAQGGGTRFFSDTGHWVTGEFLDYYEQNPNAAIDYGSPVSPAFDAYLSKDPAGTKIQYFERARFELHPENPPGLRVILTLVGEYFYDHDEIDASILIPTHSSDCRNIPRDGLPVCHAFLQYFESYGGIAQFGYPLSGLVFHEGQMVQYFQRARFEWNRNLPNGRKVTLSNIGLEYFYAIKEDPNLLRTDTDFIPEDMMQLRVNAFVDRATMPPNGIQEIVVVVQNQLFQPVAGAHVSVQVIMPTGEILNVSMSLTNSNGISKERFVVPDVPAGLARIVVKVRTSDLNITTETSFRIWK